MSQKTSFPRRLTGLRLLLIFSILAAGIIVTGYFSYQQFEQNHRLEIERQLATIADLKVSQLVHWREEQIRDGGLLFKNRAFSALVRFVLENPKDVEALQHLASWLERYKAYNYNYIRLFDCQGNDIISLPTNIPPLSEFNRQQILLALNEGQIFLQDFYFRNWNDTNAYLLLGIPILDEQNGNHPLGLVYLRISPETYLFPLIQRWPTPSRSAETILIRRDGDSVVYLNELRFAKNSTLRLRIPIDKTDMPAVKAVQGASGIIQGVDYRGVPVISYAQAVPNSPWFIVSKIDKAEVYAPIHERLWLMIAAALSLLLAAGSVIGYLYRLQSEDFYRKQYLAAEALRESETRYRRLFDASPDGIVHIGADGKITRANVAQARMYRYDSPEEMIGLHATLCVAPSSREYSSEIMSRRLKGEEVGQVEYKLIRKDGEEFWGEVSAEILREADGSVSGYICITRDTTERKLSEEALKRANASLDAVIDNIPIMVFLKDPNELRFVRFNRAGEELLGSSRDDLIGKNDYDFFPKEQADFFTEKDRQVLRDKKLVDVPEELIQTRNLGERILHTRKVPVLKENGEPEFLLGVSEDITEHKRSEKALQLSEARFKHIIESSNDVIYVLQDLKFKMLNRKFEEVTGWARKEAMAPEFDVISLYTPESRETVLERLAKRERGEAVPDRYAFKFQNKKGEIRELEVNVSEIIWDGRPASMGFCRDITEQRLLEAQLFQAQKMESVGRLAGGVAHDFNNMLQVILTNTQFSLDDQSLDASTRERLIDIQSAARHSADLTRQLLAFARKQTVAPVSLDLGEAIFKLLKVLKQMIGEDIELSLVQGAHVGRIKIDPVQVNQILANLCVNARDAISDTGKITIEVGPAELDEKYCSDHPGAKPGSYAMLKVSDTGCGMSREVVDHMFDPFFTTKAIGKGTGLGLPMVYGIVKQNNGYISVDSEIDRGTTFTLYFPLCDDAEDEDESDSERNLPRGSGQVVLLVEDDKTVLHIAKTSLEKLGYVVISAASADESLQLVKEHSGEIHLLLTDVIMPGMNGRELADQIKLVIPDIHCIFMSGYTADVIAHRGVLSQSINFLQKPFTFSDLALKVSEVIGRSSR